MWEHIIWILSCCYDTTTAALMCTFESLRCNKQSEPFILYIRNPIVLNINDSIIIFHNFMLSSVVRVVAYRTIWPEQAQKYVQVRCAASHLQTPVWHSCSDTHPCLIIFSTYGGTSAILDGIMTGTNVLDFKSLLQPYSVYPYLEAVV